MLRRMWCDEVWRLATMAERLMVARRFVYVCANDSRNDANDSNNGRDKSNRNRDNNQ